MEKPTTSPCEFQTLLDEWQDDPDQLTPEQWKSLKAHLDADPLCPTCFKRMEENAHMPDLMQRAAKELNEEGRAKK